MGLLRIERQTTTCYDVRMSNIDPKGIQFHVVSDDYFGTKATVVDLVRQDANRIGYGPRHNDAFERVRDEWVYMQEEYKIIDRDRSVAPLGAVILSCA